MNLKEAYYYVFYKLYKSFEAAPSKWLSDWKASVVLLALEIWCILPIMIYYKVLTKEDLFKESTLIIVSFTVVGVLVAIKYFAFEYDQRWKIWITKFDKLSKRQNQIGTVIILIVVLVIIINLILSFYLLSRINWSLYR